MRGEQISLLEPKPKIQKWICPIGCPYLVLQGYPQDDDEPYHDGSKCFHPSVVRERKKPVKLNWGFPCNLQPASIEDLEACPLGRNDLEPVPTIEEIKRHKELREAYYVKRTEGPCAS
jgi:hypothetical protein